MAHERVAGAAVAGDNVDDAGRQADALGGHPGIDKIAFTGSTDVGRKLRQATAGSGKRLSLELGGKSPFVVF
ncbi:MAG TPA: aldehyde dehydrogenase family protein, partial [Ktedonobacterales bacterium]|nr:aldehyde dehydrogenase family protein [Ktedonobacterales bacterium]